MLLPRPWQPTINYRHPANRGVNFSWVATRTGSMDLLRRTGGTVSGNPVIVNNAIIGAAVQFASNVDDYYTYPNRPTLNLPLTIGSIINFDTLSTVNGQCVMQNSSGAGGVSLVIGTSSTNLLMSARAVANYSPTLSLTVATPYLVVGSIAPDLTVNLLAVNLSTGVVATATSGNAGTPAAADASYRIASNDLAGRSTGGDFAATLVSNTFLNGDQLLAWAEDPWAPWREVRFTPEVLSFGPAASPGRLRTPSEVMVLSSPRVRFPRMFGGLGFGSGTTGSGLAVPSVAGSDTTGYRPAPLSEGSPSSLREAASERWLRRIVDVVNSSLRGKLNVTFTVTLNANATSTIIKDARIGAFSALIFTPLTANAAAEQAAGGLYVSEQQTGRATVEHTNSVQSDRVFRIVILA